MNIPLMQPPIRLCCGQRHYGVQCPDGLVMCCLCFDRFSISELAMENGQPIDICKSCYKHEKVNEHGNVIDYGPQFGEEEDAGRTTTDG